MSHLKRKLVLHGFDKADVQVEGQSIKVKLPPVEIMSLELDLDKSFVTMSRSGVLVSKQDTGNFLKEIFNMHRQTITEEIQQKPDVLGKARSSAEQTIRRLLSAVIDINAYQLVFV